MPPNETLVNFAATGATLAIHLSIQNADQVITDLMPVYGADCPVAVVWRASWPDQRIIRTTIAGLAEAIPEGVTRTSLILVGRVLGQEGFSESCLYATDYDRRYRPQTADSPWADWKDGND
ncbi:MAG: SAM-dependent methyltransferase, partial [Paracoccaceae bacterium]